MPLITKPLLQVPLILKNTTSEKSPEELVGAQCSVIKQPREYQYSLFLEGDPFDHSQKKLEDYLKKPCGQNYLLINYYKKGRYFFYIKFWKIKSQWYAEIERGKHYYHIKVTDEGEIYYQD